MTDNGQTSDGPQPKAAVPASLGGLARLEHLFRHQVLEDPEDRFLFELVRRYREGETR